MGSLIHEYKPKLNVKPLNMELGHTLKGFWYCSTTKFSEFTHLVTQVFFCAQLVLNVRKYRLIKGWEKLYPVYE